MEGVRNLQRESYALLKKSENRFFVFSRTASSLIWMISLLVIDANRNATVSLGARR